MKTRHKWRDNEFEVKLQREEGNKTKFRILIKLPAFNTISKANRSICNSELRKKTKKMYTRCQYNKYCQKQGNHCAGPESCSTRRYKPG